MKLPCYVSYENPCGGPEGDPSPTDRDGGGVEGRRGGRGRERQREPEIQGKKWADLLADEYTLRQALLREESTTE